VNKRAGTGSVAYHCPQQINRPWLSRWLCPRKCTWKSAVSHTIRHAVSLRTGPNPAAWIL